ncbi:LOW QUALITY PROTEIN: hypothetical protein OSB04_013697 [Centaurea solstitialis]|uniref:PGG domain-containing protein n=1 Tax=Centaurea solstitialis TaxID=347529 RepID=A0AA38TLA9_9ASTR|nr:LOW QUALITY PROTEIN: hypothetical protein OSB04_013697 [Centaurea solstitialis]
MDQIVGSRFMGSSPTLAVWLTYYTERGIDSAKTTQQEAKKEPKDKNVSTEIETKGKGATSGEIETEVEHTISIRTQGEDTLSTYAKTKEEEEEMKEKNERNKKLHKATMEGNWRDAKYILRRHEGCLKEPINPDRNTVLHLAVEMGHDHFVKSLLDYLKNEQVKEVVEIKNLYGSTALHVAAIVGNRYAAELLVGKHKELLTIQDDEGQDPLLKAYSNMQFDTFTYLLKAANDKSKTKQAISQSPEEIKRGVDLLVNAISAKQYSTALELVETFPKFAVENVYVLMEIARTFPSGLNEWETFIYPFVDIYPIDLGNILSPIIFLVVTDRVPLIIFMWIRGMTRVLVSTVYFLLYMIHFPLWKVATRLVGGIMRIEKKKQEWEEAKKILKLVCDEVDKLESSGTRHLYYDGPTFEAASRNAYPVVNEILNRWPEAIKSKDKSGYDIIQLAVIHRSEKIYNRIYQIGEHKSHYRMIEDSSGNNILHLAGGLAPSHELNRRTGAALQLQRELQWREELKKVVLSTYITKENIFKETPDMVFSREHKDLVKEGQNWMKTTAESCSITAALIITIVFAAAITVPGGSNQEKGIPLFIQDIAFTIFAVSDAISLFTSSTSLLVFLSILTSRFAEQDFLVSLPKRLLIGLCSLFISTTAMMVAFSATLFVVFCDKKPWMLAPICVSACLPIVLFLTLQLPLIVDLYLSTYVPIFGKKSNSQLARLIGIDYIEDLFDKLGNS